MGEVINLTVAKKFFERAAKSKGVEIKYEVENIYKDLGAGTKHWALVAYYNGEGFQALAPNDLDKVRQGKFTLGDLRRKVDFHIMLAR